MKNISGCRVQGTGQKPANTKKKIMQEAPTCATTAETPRPDPMRLALRPWTGAFRRGGRLSGRRGRLPDQATGQGGSSPSGSAKALKPRCAPVRSHLLFGRCCDRPRTASRVPVISRHAYLRSVAYVGGIHHQLGSSQPSSAISSLACLSPSPQPDMSSFGASSCSADIVPSSNLPPGACAVCALM